MALEDYDGVNFPGIRIENPGGATTFAATVREALTKIRSQPIGLRLLQELCASPAPTFGPWGGKIKIYRADLPVEQGGSRAMPLKEIEAKNGTGSASAVQWNSNVWVVPGQGQRPPFIGLAHELIHAWHNAYGQKKSTYDDEESFTVGLGAYMAPNPLANPASITENMIRLEHGFPVRHRY